MKSVRRITQALFETLILAATSLVITVVCVLFLQSTGAIGSGVVSLGGGAAIFVAVFLTLSRHMLRRLMPRTSPPETYRIQELWPRPAYIQAQIAAIEAARSVIRLYLNKVHTSIESKEAARINAVLRKAKERGVSVQVLIADGHDRLRGAHELSEQLGIDLRMTPRLHYSDLRFLRTDGDLAIVGLAEKALESRSYDPSDSWAQIRSHVLSQMLDEEFSGLWNEATTFREYSVSVVRGALRQHPDQPELVANVTGLPLEFVKTCIQKSDSI